MDKCPEILLDHAIHHLCLAVRLRMIRRAHLELSATELEKFLPKSTHKKGIMIEDKASGHAVNLSGGLHEYLSHYSSSAMRWKYPNVYPLGETVHHDQHCCVTLRRRQANYKVEGEVLPRSRRNW